VRLRKPKFSPRKLGIISSRFIEQQLARTAVRDTVRFSARLIAPCVSFCAVHEQRPGVVEVANRAEQLVSLRLPNLRRWQSVRELLPPRDRDGNDRLLHALPLPCGAQATISFRKVLMKTHVLALLSGAVVLCQSAFAVTAADITLDASIAYKMSTNVQCTGQDCTNRRKLTLTASQSFQLTPNQLSKLDGTTRVKLELFYYGVISFLISDDPAYHPGATSANISGNFTLFGVSTPCSVQVSWADGSFHLLLGAKVDVTGPGGIAFASLQDLKKENATAVEAKGLGSSSFAMKTTVLDTQPVMAVSVESEIVSDEVYLAMDEKSSNKAISTAEGNLTANYADQAKSKFITAAPPVVN
jgi:hypothetical protein